MKKKLSFAIATIVTTAALSTTAFAGSWQSDQRGFWWQNDDGSYPVSSWQWLDGNQDGIAECYYFDENGYMLADTKTPDGYQVNANGAWVLNGYVQTQATDANSTPSNTTTKPGPSGVSSIPYDGYTIIVNTNTKKYHTPSCRVVTRILPENLGYADDASILSTLGYDPCKLCH